MQVTIGTPGKCSAAHLNFLRRRPSAQRKTGEDGGLKMRDGVEQLARIGHFAKRGVEIGRVGEAFPELPAAVARLECARRHAEQCLGAGIEIGEHAVAVEE